MWRLGSCSIEWVGWFSFYRIGRLVSVLQNRMAGCTIEWEGWVLFRMSGYRMVCSCSIESDGLVLFHQTGWLGFVPQNRMVGFCSTEQNSWFLFLANQLRSSVWVIMHMNVYNMSAADLVHYIQVLFQEKWGRTLCLWRCPIFQRQATLRFGSSLSMYKSCT